MKKIGSGMLLLTAGLIAGGEVLSSEFYSNIILWVTAGAVSGASAFVVWNIKIHYKVRDLESNTLRLLERLIEAEEDHTEERDKIEQVNKEFKVSLHEAERLNLDRFNKTDILLTENNGLIKSLTEAYKSMDHTLKELLTDALRRGKDERN